MSGTTHQSPFYKLSPNLQSWYHGSGDSQARTHCLSASDQSRAGREQMAQLLSGHHCLGDGQEALCQTTDDTETVHPLQGLTGLRKHWEEKRREGDWLTLKLWSQTGQQDLKVTPKCHSVREQSWKQLHLWVALRRRSPPRDRPQPQS